MEKIEPHAPNVNNNLDWYTLKIQTPEKLIELKYAYDKGGIVFKLIGGYYGYSKKD